MTDRLDDLLFSIGEEQNDRVDFDQMYADLLQKQKEEEKQKQVLSKEDKKADQTMGKC